MKTTIFLFVLLSISLSSFCQVNVSTDKSLPVKMEELTAPDFIKAVNQSGGTCIIPLGIIEKHGPHLPLGTDLIDVRELTLRATAKEYTIIFPAFYFGQIFEAKHQPGTMAYSSELVWEVLQETCDQLNRNGITKIILVNGHGGNTNLLQYFCQAQLEKQKGYAVFLFQPQDTRELRDKVQEMRKTDYGGHADETETSMMLAHRPDLVHLDRAGEQSGIDQDRLNLRYAYTGIWWYASYPNHYAGDGGPATAELGNLILNARAEQLAEMIRAIKQDNKTIELQNQFYRESKEPLKTGQ